MYRNYNVDDGRLVAVSDGGEITIIHQNTMDYRGRLFSRMQYRMLSEQDYESITTITSVSNHKKACGEFIVSQKQGKHVNISTPFSELESVGNEISLYMLHEYNVLTMRAVACINKETLVLFLGKSNSGKSTAAHFLKMQYTPVKLLSDDFICLRVDQSSIQCSVPVWDSFSDYPDQSIWETVCSVILVDLNKDTIISQPKDIAYYSIGGGFSPEISIDIFALVDKLLGANCRWTVFPGEYQNAYSVIDKITKILKGAAGE